MSDFYEPEMADPGEGDMLGALAAVACEHAGHSWVHAGGGMLLCSCCEATGWEEGRRPRDLMAALEASLSDSAPPLPSPDLPKETP